jgi:superfamily II DNA/RNA helicase
MHRIGRAGRFGTPGLAVTIYDRELDEKAFWNIIKNYKMEAKVQKLDGGPNQIASLLDGLTEKGMD